MSVSAALALAFGLSMDSFAVALARGAACRGPGLPEALRVGIAFALVQMAMPLVGWCVGTLVAGRVAAAGPWIACGVLVAVGAAMIRNALAGETGEPDQAAAGRTLALLVGMALATSLDALAVGVGLAFLDTAVSMVVVSVGVVTFAAGFAGVLIGQTCTGLFGRWAELAGGGTLIGLGLRLVLDRAVA